MAVGYRQSVPVTQVTDMTNPSILVNTGARTLNTVSIWVWLLTGDAHLILEAYRLLKSSGNDTRAFRLLTEAVDWGLV